MADSQDSNDAAAVPPQDTATQAVAEGGAYEVIRKRLTEQGETLDTLITELNQARLDEFGHSDMQVIARTRIRTENNCIARDMVHIGDSLLFGYNVFIGLKQETKLEDVFALFKLEQNSDDPSQVELIQQSLEGSFLTQDNFVRDFTELYRYYKKTRLIQIIAKEGKLLAAFQIGERTEDIRVFRWALSADGRQCTYIDNRGERDIALPPAYDFEWQETGRDDLVNGKHAHINILDTVFVETLNGTLTIKIENNTADGRGIYQEGVQDKTQSLDDADIFYAKVGNLILLKILPYRETQWRYLIYNTLTEAVMRLDAIGQSCVQLPEDQGIVFPGGYYLQTGEHKTFDEHAEANDLKYLRKISSPNGEDILYLFYDVRVGVTGLFSYNLIRKTLQNPIYCHGYALADNGQLVLFSAEDEPTRIHPMQLWQTPFYSDEFASKQAVSNTFYGKIGNAELVKGIAELFSIVKLVNNQDVSQKLYSELARRVVKVFDDYYWLEDQTVEALSLQLHQVKQTAELVIDEFVKVQSIQKQADKALDTAQTEQQRLIQQIKTTTFQQIVDYVDALASICEQKGQLVGLKSQRYINEEVLTALNAELDEVAQDLSAQTVEFLQQDTALAPFEAQLTAYNERLQDIETNAQLQPLLADINQSASSLDMLTELLGTLNVGDATIRTQILDDISAIYARLNQTKAQATNKQSNLGSAEAVAQFGAQFKLFSQSVANALGQTQTPEQADEQLSRLLLQLEELESQFIGDNPQLGDRFMSDIMDKREEIYESFENRKQQLLDERGRKAEQLSSAAKRMLASIEKRSKKVDSDKALNQYFATDTLVQKVNELVDQLGDLDQSVKADDIAGELKRLRDQAFRNLRDKSDLFEEGGKVIKLGSHKFSVNTQPIDLTILPKDGVLNAHITGTDYYQPIDNPSLNALQDYWQMALPSETPAVYRAEYLAYDILTQALKRQNGLELGALTRAALQLKNDALQGSTDADNTSDPATAPSPEQINQSQLYHIVQQYAAPRYQMGYQKGVHDYDATLILTALLPVYQQAGVLKYDTSSRALAQVLWWQLQNGYCVENITTDQSIQPDTWLARAQSAQQLADILGSDQAIRLLEREITAALDDFIAKTSFRLDMQQSLDARQDSQITLASQDSEQASNKAQSLVTNASSYLVVELGKQQDAQSLVFSSSQPAQEMLDDFVNSLTELQWQELQHVLSALSEQPQQQWLLAKAWLTGFVSHGAKSADTTKKNDNLKDSNMSESPADQTGSDSNDADVNQHRQDDVSLAEHIEQTNVVDEAVAILLTSKAAFAPYYTSRMTQGSGADANLSSSPISSSLEVSSLSSLAHPVGQTDTLAESLGETLSHHTSSMDTRIHVTGLLGSHTLLMQSADSNAQTLHFQLDDFLQRLEHHQTVILPTYQRYLHERQQVIATQKQQLRLDELQARPLSSFVRNKLISNSYLPLIGDNLAKQMGTVGDNKRTDLMGLLMMISPPGYGKTTLMEYVANRLGLIFMKINCPALGHDVTSLDPEQAPNSTAHKELNKLNLALEMGNNVMLYLDDIQHTHPEFLQKFISLTDGTRRIEGVWQGETKTYDMRGRKFCVVMAGNPYTESGEKFQVPDMLANRADIYNLGDILTGMEDYFALSYIENAMTSNQVLAPLATREMQDIYTLIDMARGKTPKAENLSHPYSRAELDEIINILQKMFYIQKVILKVNQAYIQSAATDDKYRTEPAFLLQGSYRNMNKLTEKLAAVMNQDELQDLISDHYQGEAQLLTQGAEANLLKLAELRDTLSESQSQRWQAIKQEFQRNQAMGGDDTDTGQKVVAQLVDVVRGFDTINQSIEAVAQNQIDKDGQDTLNTLLETQMTQTQAWQQTLNDVTKGHAEVVSESIDKGFENTVARMLQVYKHQSQTEKNYNEQHLQRYQILGEALQRIANRDENDTVVQQAALQHQSSANQSSSDTADNNIAKHLSILLNPLLTQLEQKVELDRKTQLTGEQMVKALQRLNVIIEDLDEEEE